MNTLAHPGGRPREYDIENFADKLLEWAKLPDSYNLNGFCAQNLIAAKKISEWAKVSEKFRESYEITRAILADRRERGLVEGKVHTKAYDLNITVYDEFTKADYQEKKVFESSIANQSPDKNASDLNKPS